MKLLNKQEGLFINENQKIKLSIAISILTISLYIVAMICSIFGIDYFVLNYQNDWLNKLGDWLKERNLVAFLDDFLITIETSIILTFVLNKRPKWYFIVSIYAIPLIIAYSIGYMPSYLETTLLIAFCIVIPLFTQLIDTKKICIRIYLLQLLRFLIAVIVSVGMQAMVFTIKSGYFDGVNHIQPISNAFMFALEYDIALIVVLYTAALLLNRGKGDNKIWISHKVGGSSQTSKMQLQKSNWKKLNKNQRNKIRLLIIKTYFIQIGAFLLVMALPFIIGKVFELLTMYLSFAIVRYILGFNYSLHFKKESICVSVSVLIFGILTLVVPFFYINLIGAIIFGSSLAVLLHLSYKYKSMFLFMQASNTDRYATLFVAFDGDLSERHIKAICNHRGIDKNTANIVYSFMQKDKISYLAIKYNYSQRSICYKIDDAIEKLS